MDPLSEYAAYGEEVGARLSQQTLQMKLIRHLGVSRQELFDYITNFDRLSEWIPGVRRSWSDDSNAETPGQVGAVRMLANGVAKPTREIVKAYEAPRMLAYSATDASLFGLYTDHLSVLTCDAHPGGGSVFCWLAYGRPADNAIKRWAGKKTFQVALGGGIKALERKFPTN